MDCVRQPGRPAQGSDLKLVRLAPAFIVILSGMVAALHIGKMPSAIPVLRESLGVTLVEAGFLLSMVQFAGMSVGVLVGVATDGIGLRRSVVAGQLILAIASFSGIWAQRPADLLALRALEGLGFLLVVLPAPNLIRQLVPLGELALHLGLWGTYMATGMSTALIGGPAIINALGWHGLWGLLAGASATMALWLFMHVPADRMRQGAAQAQAPAAAGEPWWQRLRLTLTRSGPWRVAIAFSMYSSQWLAVIGFLPSIYAQAGLSGQVAGTLTAVACLVNVTGNIAAGRLLHRRVNARHLLYVGFISMALATFLTFGQLTSEAPIVRYVAVLLFSAVGGLIPGTLFSLAVHVAPNERTVSTTVGWIQQCSSSGQFIGPPLVAWVATESGGWHWTWVATGIASIVGLLLAKGVNFDKHA
jgi:MFS transporter, CP family, cyanate transporter